MEREKISSRSFGGQQVRMCDGWWCRALVLVQEVSLMLRSSWKTLVWVLVVLAVIWYLLTVQYGSLPAFHLPL